MSRRDDEMALLMMLNDFDVGGEKIEKPPAPASVVSVEFYPEPGNPLTATGIIFKFDQPVTAKGAIEVGDHNLEISDLDAIEVWAECIGAYQVDETSVYCTFQDYDPPGLTTVSGWRITGPLSSIECAAGFEVQQGEF